MLWRNTTGWLATIIGCLLLLVCTHSLVATVENRGKVEQRSGLQWVRLSSKAGDLPTPGPSTEQTGALVADLDNDGINDFVISFRKTAPALVWYRRTGNGWDRYVIENDYLPLEAGGAVHDIDGDGYPDLVFGADGRGDELWWWENPAGQYNPAGPWTRHVIKNGGGHQHHDQIFGDFKGTGKPKLVFWNQGANTLFIADIPDHPRAAQGWKFEEVYSGSAGERPGEYSEGLAAIDIDGDGKLDILAGNLWFKHIGGSHFTPVKIAGFGGRVAAGRLIKNARYPQVVINSGDGVGPLKWYECRGNPMKSSDWVGHDLVGRNVIHGHSLQIADIDGDGNLDIFAAEMAKWTEQRSDADNPSSTAWIFFGDGKGHFRKTQFSKGIDFHEARVADLNGDGRADILNKPYNWATPGVDVWLQAPKQAVRVRRLDTGAEPAAHERIHIGLQLYSLRRQLTKDLPGTLKLVPGMDITDVETAGFHNLTADQFRRQLDHAGLRASGAHFEWDRFSTDIAGIIEDANALRVEYVTLSWIPHNGDFTVDKVQGAAKTMNEWGRKLREAGLRFSYHPHGYDFRPHNNGTLFDVLAKETNPEHVNFELDIFWASHAGVDPVKLMQKYPTRFPLMHLKDMKTGTKIPKYTGQEDVEVNVTLGQGQLNIPAILREAGKIGVKHYYIEDESSRSIQQMPASIKYIRSIGY